MCVCIYIHTYIYVCMCVCVCVCVYIVCECVPLALWGAGNFLSGALPVGGPWHGPFLASIA